MGMGICKHRWASNNKIMHARLHETTEPGNEIQEDDNTKPGTF